MFSRKAGEDEKSYICQFPEKLTLELKPERNMINIKVKKTSFFSFNKSKHILFDSSEDYKDFLKVFELAKDESESK